MHSQHRVRLSDELVLFLQLSQYSSSVIRIQLAMEEIQVATVCSLPEYAYGTRTVKKCNYIL